MYAYALTTTVFYEVIIAVPKDDDARKTMKIRKRRHLRGRLWDDPEQHFLFRVFWLLDGIRDHRSIARMLHREASEVEYAIICLVDEKLVNSRSERRAYSTRTQALRETDPAALAMLSGGR